MGKGESALFSNSASSLDCTASTSSSFKTITNLQICDSIDATWAAGKTKLASSNGVSKDWGCSVKYSDSKPSSGASSSWLGNTKSIEYERKSSLVWSGSTSEHDFSYTFATKDLDEIKVTAWVKFDAWIPAYDLTNDYNVWGFKFENGGDEYWNTIQPV